MSSDEQVRAGEEADWLREVVQRAFPMDEFWFRRDRAIELAVNAVRAALRSLATKDSADGQ